MVDTRNCINIKSMMILFIIIFTGCMHYEDKQTLTNYQKIIDDCKIELDQIMVIKSESDIIYYLGIKAEEISDQIKMILKDFKKMYVESLQIECIPVGLLVGYKSFFGDIVLDNAVPTIFERYKNANPYDLIICYNDILPPIILDTKLA